MGVPACPAKGSGEKKHQLELSLTPDTEFDTPTISGEIKKITMENLTNTHP
jgi:hypothetical protein